MRPGHFIFWYNSDMREKPLVLVVDDEEAFLEIVSAKLEVGGFDVIIAHSASEAEAKAESLQPDLVLSDIYMPPGPSGWDLALALHDGQKTSGIKFAFFTSLRDPLAELHGDKKIASHRLGDVKIFSKTDDVSVLAEDIGRLIAG